MELQNEDIVKVIISFLQSCSDELKVVCKLWYGYVRELIKTGKVNCTLLKTPSSKFWVIDNFSDDLYPLLKTLPIMREPIIRIGGKVCHQRRDIGFFSDESKGYRYSGQIAKSLPLKDHHFLVKVLNKVNRYLNTKFNGILVNQYS